MKQQLNISLFTIYRVTLYTITGHVVTSDFIKVNKTSDSTCIY